VPNGRTGTAWEPSKQEKFSDPPRPKIQYILCSPSSSSPLSLAHSCDSLGKYQIPYDTQTAVKTTNEDWMEYLQGNQRENRLICTVIFMIHNLYCQTQHTIKLDRLIINKGRGMR
jgi:hypothetical protein